MINAFSVSTQTGDQSPTAKQQSAAAATDRLAQLLKELQAEQVASTSTSAQMTPASSVVSSSPTPGQSAQVASLASALSSFQTKTTPNLPVPPQESVAMSAPSPIQSSVGVDRFESVMNQVKQRYAQSRPTLTDLLQVAQGSSSPTSATPTRPVMPQSPEIVKRPEIMPTPPQPMAVPKSGLKQYVAKLATHLSQHGRLVLTDYRVGSTV